MNNSSHNDLTAHLHQGLSRIPSDWQLCLLDGKKVPQGIGWQQKPLTPVQMKEAVTNGWIVDKADGTQYRCYPKGYGLITGTPVTINSETFYLMALDQDGASAREKILQLSGGEELPKTVAFTSGRPGRCQYLFLIPEQYAPSLRTKKFLTDVTGDDGKSEQLELRWTGLQSCLPPSIHPTTGEYIWVSGCAPDEIPIALAPIWLIEAMLVENEITNGSSTPHTHYQEPKWTDIDWALSYLAALSPSRVDDYNQWCNVGMILKSIDNSLFYEWDKWSRLSSKYQPGECEKKWKTFNKNGVGIGTLAHWAKQDGWTSPFKNKNVINNGKNYQTNSSNSNGNGNHHFLYDQVTTIVTSNLNPPQQTAAIIELSSDNSYPLKGVKDLAVEIETYINQTDSKTENVLELKRLLNYRREQLNISQILPTPLASALLSKANSDCIDPVYLYQYLLAACGSEMGGHIGIIGKEGATLTDSWIEYPIFWTMVVALPSAGKSQTMRSVFSPIKKRYKQAKTEYQKVQQQLENLKEQWEEKSQQQKEKLQDSPENPRIFKATMPAPPPKKIIEAGSPEGAIRRMSELTPRTGCTWVFDELVRLLKLDQYKDKGGDTRQILLQTWNAPADIEFERSKEENAFHLKDICLNLTGATQLSKVKQLFSDPDDGDGLISRFLVALPTTPSNFAVWSDLKVAIDQELQELYDHLRLLHKRLSQTQEDEEQELSPLFLSFTKEAQQRWKRWWEEVRRNQQTVEFENPAFFAYLGKMLSQTLRLALLLHCMELKYEQKNDPFQVGIDTLEKAILAAKFSIGQFRILQTNNHATDEMPGRLSLIHAYALRKGTEVSAVQVQNSVFKRAKPKPTLAEIRQDFAILTENGYTVLSGKGKDLRIRAIPVDQARVGNPKSSEPYSDTSQNFRTQTSRGTQPPVTRISDYSDNSWTTPTTNGNLQNNSNNSTNGRNCPNYDDAVPSKVDFEPISNENTASEICPNDVGNSENILSSNVPTSETPARGNGGNYDDVNERSQNQAEERHLNLEQLQTLLACYSSAKALAQASPEMPTESIVSLFAPLDNLLRSWGIEPIGKVSEQVPYNPQLHQPDTDDLIEGESVFIKFVGYRDGSRILCPAQVSRTRNC
ncbi:hypothetical protein NIES2119_18250 [[Phormidium ambiguum] IAM M-71]|uniref:DNA primase/polymerase bifunctional N-terminal domain-containing protein n=1 Tax=[Phormidium ambiguum] IAM M-71 TaxID=454136 RepID=A0A1U7IGN2_9CYAN|nr:DUF3987 domain-containing protein [Phormidium ambiguum]OKH36242.1 hypothetical protein NIES2119_18250 [Phormidium ambiguum IAM M-71]